MGLLENAAYQVPVANLGERCRKTTRQGLLGREVSVQMRLVEQVPGETPAESLPYR